MKNKHKRMLKGAAVWLLAAMAGTATAQRLTLQEAVNIALRNSLDIQIARNNVQASDINNHIGVAGGLPTVSATVTNTEQVTTVNQKLNNGTIIQRDWAAGNNLQANVTASQLLYNGMRVVATKRRLEELERQSEQLLNVQIQNIMATVMLQYYDVVRQQSYVRTLEQAIAAAQQRLNIFQVRKEVGMANNADIFQAQIDVNTLHQTLQQQNLIIEQAKTDLLRTLNLRPDSLVQIADTIVVERGLLLATVLESIDRNPEILAAEQQVRINEQIERETAAQRYPTVRLNGGVNFGRNQAGAGQVLYNQSFGPNLGLSVGIPIYNGGAVKRQQRVAGLNTENARLQRENALRDLQAGAVRNYQAYVNTLSQVDSARKNYELARQLMDLAYLRFELGQATIIELREAQRSFEEAGYRLVNLSFAAKAAEIELRRLSNRLSF